MSGYDPEEYAKERERLTPEAEAAEILNLAREKAKFLSEVERLAGATREEMLKTIGRVMAGKMSQEAVWLCRILGDPK